MSFLVFPPLPPKKIYFAVLPYRLLLLKREGIGVTLHYYLPQVFTCRIRASCWDLSEGSEAQWEPGRHILLCRNSYPRLTCMLATHWRQERIRSIVDEAQEQLFYTILPLKWKTSSFPNYFPQSIWVSK